MQLNSFIDKIVYKCDYFFVTQECLDNRKTPIYYVFDNNAVCIAQLKWYGAWRKFCLYPEGKDTIWDKKCLMKIIDLLDDITTKYKNSKKEK